MKLQLRILTAQLPALGVILLLLGWGGVALRQLGQESERILADNYRSVLAAQRMKEAIERLDSAALFSVSGEDEKAHALVLQNRPIFETELQVEEGNLTEETEGETAERLRAAWTAYGKAYDQFLLLPPDQRRSFYFVSLLPAFQLVKTNADAVLVLNQDAMLRKSDAASRGATRARQVWLLVSLAGVAAALGLGILVSRRITEPLQVLEAAAGRVGEGNLELRLPLTGITESDAVARAFNQMGERLRLYRKASQSELARSREAAQAAIESLLEPVLVFTAGGELRICNGAAQRLFGPISRRLDGVDPSLKAAVEAACAMVVREGKASIPVDFSSVILIQTAEGERALLPHAVPMRDGTGELVGITVLLQDVSRLRRMDELKGNLVQTVAHELRTPLTSLGMALHLCLDERVGGQLSPRLAELLDAARDDVRRLRTLVEDLLDLSRIQEGKLLLRIEECSPSGLLAGVMLEHRNESIRIEAQPGNLQADPARLSIALQNLLSNALKHAGPPVVMRAFPIATGWRFEVEDEGSGVPEDQRSRIFERFVRGESSGGSGLGLYIAQQIVLAHGGKIGVESGQRGAKFWMEIPGQRADGAG